MPQVFDGHNGKDAAQFVKEELLNFIVRDAAFPTSVEKAVRHAFLHADTAFAEACSANQNLSSGTTALTVLVLGRFVNVFIRKYRLKEMSQVVFLTQTIMWAQFGLFILTKKLFKISFSVIRADSY